ncbi:MAG: GNAT family N-acetyltransferase [Proteobacteria bacterium]|nr:GNAT family N-acetyltransferase [Pseudomonadota bacterium]
MKMIVTDRLIIQPWTKNHAENFFELSLDETFNIYPITRYSQQNIESARAWIENEVTIHQETGLGKVGVWLEETRSLIGMVGLTTWRFDGESLVDLTYRLRQSALGKGYGAEAAIAMTSYGFHSLQLDQITATIAPGNLPSIKLADRLGMKFDRRIILKNVDTDLYRLHRHDFKDTSSKSESFY